MLQTKQFEVRKGMTDSTIQETDIVAVEEPLTIFVTTDLLDKNEFAHPESRQLYSVTMRTPGSDEKLVAGLLFAEGVVCSKQDIVQIVHCHHLSSGNDGSKLNDNSILAHLRPSCANRLNNKRNINIVSSACGICGSVLIQELDRLQSSLDQSHDFNLTFDEAMLATLPMKLAGCQSVFNQTGGLHAAAIVNLDGKIDSIFEDVGRHNALDKLIGEAVLKDTLPYSNKLLLMTSRLSYEIIQKAVRAGIVIIAAMGAPSSLAIELAQKFDITLIGFLRRDRFNIYSSPERIIRSGL